VGQASLVDEQQGMLLRVVFECAHGRLG
jgi:hypothetical protein